MLSAFASPTAAVREMPSLVRPHEPVLLEEITRLLAPLAGATVIDATFGAGGHSAALTAAIGATGRLIAIDRDPEAKEHFDRLAREVPCAMRFVRGDFADVLPKIAADGIKADAIMMDLGVSSMQVDRPERGFSYSRQAPLDMRMDPDLPRSAADLIAESGAAELAGWFREYGEERYARPIARAIVRAREEESVATTTDLVEVIRRAIPIPAQFAGGHPAKRVFQALRIVVNDELGSLVRALPSAFSALAPGGRLAVISFHSLEDRAVKRFMAARAKGCTCPPELPACVCGRTPEGMLRTARAVMPKADEIERNPRARSARLRVVASTGGAD